MRTVAYRLYLVFVVSWFLHMPTRIRPLGLLRLDLLLLLFITMLIFFSKPDDQGGEPSDPPAPPLPPAASGGTQKIIKIMFAYIVLSLPLVEWPGSVIKDGLPDYIKAVVFYFFTISLITTEARLKTFMKVFLTCQAFRVIEPVVLHVTTGYWGSVASMGNWEAMDRLSGAPSDVINPNGLAFVILMVYPFLHYLTSVSWKNKVVYVIVAPVLVYALMLTASRTGFVCMVVVLAGFWWKSRYKIVLTILMAVGMVATFSFLSADLKDRYLSLVSDDTKNSGTAEGRLTQFMENIEVGMRKPIVGHGLGTSAEANGNYGSYGKIAHNLYAEIFQELGLIGLVIFVFFIKSILLNFRDSMVVLKSRDSPGKFLPALTDAMQVWMIMNIAFSFASFGFSSYEWYLFGGLSLVLRNIALQQAIKDDATGDEPREEENPWPGTAPA